MNNKGKPKVTIQITRGNRAALAWTNDNGDLLAQGNEPKLTRTVALAALGIITKSHAR